MKRLLLIRPDGIGDFIVFSAVLEEFGRVYRGWQMDVVCSRTARELAEAIPLFSRRFYVDPYRPYSLFNLRAAARLFFFGRYDVAIYAVYSRFKLGDYLAFAARSREKITFDGDNCNDPFGRRVRRNRWYSRIIEGEKREKLELERNVELVNKLGGRLEVAQALPRIWFTEGDAAQARELQQRFHLEGAGYLAVFPGAGARFRWWDSAKWAEVLKLYIRECPGSPVVILGHGADKELIEAILEQAGDCRSAIANLYGLTTLRVAAKLIQQARMLVTAETSAVHIGAAVGTPTLCLIGGGHFGRFYPYGDLTRNRVAFHRLDCFGCNWDCRNETPYACIRNLETQEVWRELKGLISLMGIRSERETTKDTKDTKMPGGNCAGPGGESITKE